jgi:hypothetical protein
MTKFWIFFVCVFGITMGLSLTKSQWNCNFLEALICSFCKITVVYCDSVKVTVNSNKHVLVYTVFNAFDICLVFGFSLRFSISIHFLLSYFWEYVLALTSRCNFQQSLNRELGILLYLYLYIAFHVYNLHQNTVFCRVLFSQLGWGVWRLTICNP